MRTRSTAVLQALVAKMDQHGRRARRVEFNGTTHRGDGLARRTGACQRKTPSGMSIGQVRLQRQSSFVEGQCLGREAGVDQQCTELRERPHIAGGNLNCALRRHDRVIKLGHQATLARRVGEVTRCPCARCFAYILHNVNCGTTIIRCIAARIVVSSVRTKKISKG